ncbi:hypothetical protein DL93DRAFT_2084032 [Clavulina sp. PMI_390]|nr:hypothetical protein DL93DRAFT_2084032 [Clavulina sp. PMI_390]
MSQNHLHPYSQAQQQQQQSQSSAMASSTSANGSAATTTTTASVNTSTTTSNSGRMFVLPPTQVDTTFVPQNTGDMICYLWFSTNLGKSTERERSRNGTTTSPKTSTGPSRLGASSPMKTSASSSASGSTSLPTPSSLTSSPSTSATATSSPSTSSSAGNAAYESHRLQLQFAPSPAFIAFLGTLLRTTQVSQGVIILSLHYIYRLKLKNPHIRGLEGSEFRLAVIALMLANKFLDE